MTAKLQMWQLQQRQSLPIQAKIEFSKIRIREFYDQMGGNVYITFSGGRDSTVMLHLVRQIYPEVPAVFVDTGLEFPEIRDFVKIISNVIWLHPKMGFIPIIEKYGYPVVSKEVSKIISRYRNTKDPIMKEYYLTGNKHSKFVGKKGVIPEKWKYLIDSDIKISDICCDIMKKLPFKQYEKETHNYPFIGTMASDSDRRKQKYLEYGCNVFTGKAISSRPLSIWTSTDILSYIKKYDLKYSKIYDMGANHTGCVYCLFGCHLETYPNRIQKLADTHPNLYKYALDKLNYRHIMELLKLPYEQQRKLLW